MVDGRHLATRCVAVAVSFVNLSDLDEILYAEANCDYDEYCTTKIQDRSI